MRRRAMAMTMRTVLVAVILLGVPLGGAWVIIALRTTAGGSARIQVVATVLLTLVALSSVAVAAASVVASKAARRISAPLIYLAAEAEQLGSGQVRPRLRSSGIEEIDLVQAELVRSAERVAGRLAAERQFASDASHQLRTPLTSLSLRLEEIELLASEEEVRKEARACLEQVERLTGVVEDLLQVSRRTGGGTTEALHLSEVFAQQEEEWGPAFEAAGRSLTFVDEVRQPVLATPGSLAQVLATIIENSLRYGAGTTEVSVRSANGGHGVFIDVADQGEGVAEDIAQHVFERNVSGHGSTGVGLALAKDLVEADGGRIELSRRCPAVFSVLLNAVPKSLDPNNVLPQGALVSVGRRRRF
ncbi:sensor histidine kinase [Actinomyces sp. 2119]|uniref:histidine kinase n=1 Tax=Actinomyces lilanjuaniae TaxID=2321394 RepID=A0ABM6Z4Z5_9ACTO|nr:MULTISPECIES: HAMP domain-containing sensor histidine kinase [Actinomyces]AYD90278.1 sensor histidine kinase [Actinomyces lilanjuaniae]RJF41544.1 sensor histidine kinase [Actinomyces sp. 2119]